MMGDPSKARRIGILGGSFDPVHLGHLIIAQDAMEKLELDEVVFMPASVPPHKQHLEQAGARDRLHMLKLAVEGDIRFSVSDDEIQRGGVSFTIDTLLAMKEQRPEVEWVLIVGSDTLVELHTWYRISDLLGLCELASFIRPGEDDMDAIALRVQLPPVAKEKLLGNLIDAHRIEISSTDIRMRVAEGLGIRYLVPPEVEMYIYEHSLYQG